MGDQIIFDRSKSGIIDFNYDFSKIQNHTPTKGMNIEKIKVFIDRSSMEFFFNDGALVITALVFPKSAYTFLKTQGIKEDLSIHQLISLWKINK
jgi:fructan beta-fructosidase